MRTSEKVWLITVSIVCSLVPHAQSIRHAKPFSQSIWAVGVTCDALCHAAICTPLQIAHPPQLGLFAHRVLIAWAPELSMRSL